MSERILVIAPHPDDETFGCAGTLLKLKEEKKEVFWLIITGISEQGGFTKEAVSIRQQQLKAISEFYAFGDTLKLDYPTAMLDTVGRKKLIETMAAAIDRVRPDTIFLPWTGDVHSDHRITAQACISCAKTFRRPFIRKMLVYEVVSETEFALASFSGFVPNSFSDITSYIDKKIKAMRMYQDELAAPPFPRSVENVRALALFRGSQAGCEYAEGFMLIKDLW